MPTATATRAVKTRSTLPGPERLAERRDDPSDVSSATVTVKVPPEAGHVAILRTTVGAFAARQHLTLDQVDDLRMGVEEAAVQLLRHASDGPLSMEITSLGDGVQVRLEAAVQEGAAIIERTSWSWMILTALADDISVERREGVASVVLVKNRLAGVDAEGGPQGGPQGER